MTYLYEGPVTKSNDMARVVWGLVYNQKALFYKIYQAILAEMKHSFSTKSLLIFD